MKKNLLHKAAAVLTMLVLALVITGVPGTALAAITGVTITPGAGQSYTIPVGGTVDLTAVVAGTPDGTVTYSWAQSSLTNVSLSAVSGATTTVTGLVPGTSTTVTVTATDDVGPVSVSNTVTITVTAMTISNSTLSLNGGATQTLTVGNVSSSSTTGWVSNNLNVATVNATTGLVTAVGGGTATITATNTPLSGDVQTRTCTVTVSPIITMTPSTQNITSASTAGSIQLRVEYGGDLITSASTVAWGNSNATAGSLTVAPTTFTVDGSALTCTATFLSNSTGVNATSTVTATIAGAGSYTAARTATVNVRTSRYLTLEGNTALSNTNRYGDYTLTLREANGDIVNDSTSSAHWSWSSSYLSLSNAALNSSRGSMINGQARIQLYARYNTPSSGTRLYAWINNDSNNRVYTTIHITGLSSLPQTGQDMTLVYILGGTAVALLAAAGVWYGIRKKRTAA
ncbi:MAG: Ig-like domain-containing protein [Eubacteriales bacterium]|jgi:LPXTG-motif cell wall-anchored protein|nr:Ig-like domain-containing protein [Eubacteriales bacterium]